MKYKVGAKKLLDESDSADKKIDNSMKKGQSSLRVQISKLESDIVDAEETVSEAEEAYQNSKYAVPFNLEKIDNAEFNLNKAKASLKSLQDDLSSRKALMKELF